MVTLSKREEDVLRLSGQGFSIREIAASLGIGERSAKHHSDVLRIKFECERRRQLIPVAQSYFEDER